MSTSTRLSDYSGIIAWRAAEMLVGGLWNPALAGNRCKWWRTVFVESEFWRISRARFAAPVAEAMLPASLLERFGKDPGRRLLALLGFLAPISGGPVSQGI